MMRQASSLKSASDERIVEVESDEDFRVDLVDVVLQGHDVRTGVDQVDGRTDLVGAIERVDDFRHVDKADHNIVIFLDTGSSQRTGALVDVVE